MGATRFSGYAKSDWEVDLTVAQAGQIRTSYFNAFPGLRNWQRRQGNEQVTRTVAGRRRVVGKGKYTLALNSPVQGTGADGLKLALALLWETPGPQGAFPVLAVHDELVIEAPAAKAEEAEQWLTDAMKAGMQEYLKVVPIQVETAVGETY